MDDDLKIFTIDVDESTLKDTDEIQNVCLEVEKVDRTEFDIVVISIKLGNEHFFQVETDYEDQVLFVIDSELKNLLVDVVYYLRKEDILSRVGLAEFAPVEVDGVETYRAPIVCEF